MTSVQTCHMKDARAFDSWSQALEARHTGLRFRRAEVSGETVLRSECGGLRVFWIYEGEGEVLLPAGFRTKEGDGAPLPPEYVPGKMTSKFAEALSVLEKHVDDLSTALRGTAVSILSRRMNDTYAGDCANDLWKLRHVPEPWTTDPRVRLALETLFDEYREQGYSVKSTTSLERVIEGDQLIAAGNDAVTTRGRFSCFTIENVARHTSHIPAAMRLRYLRDSSGGCNFDFDPFRRLPLTWYWNLRGETGDGLNVVNSHVVNIAQETSPTHFHPPQAVGGAAPQNEIYLVLNPQTYALNTYGRKARLYLFPDLRNLRRCEALDLAPGTLVYIPAGIGHRGIDVFVNVITVPGFKPHNEYYLDHDIRDAASETAPYNADLIHLKNYASLDAVLASS